MSQTTVTLAGGALLAVWFALRWEVLSASQESLGRAVVGIVLAATLLLRPKRKGERPPARPPSGRRRLAVAVGGVLLAVAGLALGIRQFEWVGLLLVVCAAWQWGLPDEQGPDVCRALLLLYLVLPLPAAIEGQLRLAMQRLSVWGGEWVLHTIGVPVWSHGLVLYANGGRAFEVPEACSGMRTAMTVILLALGTSFAMRFTRRETIVFTLLAAPQALVANLLRIVALVALAAGKPEHWPRQFVHDTTGIILLGSIVLVPLEAVLWRRWLKKRWIVARHRKSQGKRFRATLPNIAFRLAWQLAVLLVVLGLLAGIFRHRPACRAERVHQLLEPLARTAPPGIAEAAARYVVSHAPDNAEYRLSLARILLLDQRYANALDEINRAGGAKNDPSRALLMAWAWLGLHRADEAAALLDALPPDNRTHPGVAITRAELQAAQGDHTALPDLLPVAARWPILMPRVRRLYPLLAANGHWVTIAQLEASRPPPGNAEELRLTAVAFLALGRTAEADHVMRAAPPAQWERDPRFLDVVVTLAMTERGGYWETRFDRIFRRGLTELPPGAIADVFRPCFSLGRSDLAWLAYRRMQTIAPSHPALLLAAARHADRWLRVRPGLFSAVGLSNDGSGEIDLAQLAGLLATIPGVRSALARIPLLTDLTSDNAETVRERHATRCLLAFESAPAKGVDTPNMQLMYAEVLELAHRYADALDVLNRLEKSTPALRSSVLARRAAILMAQDDWGAAYETLRELQAELPVAAPPLQVMGITTLRKLGLGLQAWDLSHRAVRLFPASDQLAEAHAAVLHDFDHTEEALFVLSHGGRRLPATRLAYVLLRETRRDAEAARIARVAGISAPDIAPLLELPTLPAAESTLHWPQHRATEQKNSVDAAQATVAAPRTSQVGHSPFVSALDQATAQDRATRTDGSTAPSKLDAWECLGRDPSERAAALHRLAVLNAARGSTEDALAAVARAIELAPSSAVLRRMAIALSNGNRDTIRKARAVCPEDGEIWLAALVADTLDNRTPGDVQRDVQEATDANRFSAGTFVRAADFLLRKGNLPAARAAVAHAVRTGMGYVPAMAVGIRVGLAEHDADWTLRCAMQGHELAPNIPVFVKTLVHTRMARGETSAALAGLLRLLREWEPDATEWCERLGTLELARGRANEAAAAFAPLLNRLSEVSGSAVLIAMADAMRRHGRNDLNMSILRHARGVYPENIHVLNNLVLALDAEPETKAEAMRLLPELLALGEPAFVCDTAAVLYARAGDADAATRFATRATTLARIDSPDWCEIHLNAADIYCRNGDTARAKATLDTIEQRAPSSNTPRSEWRERVRNLRSRITAAEQRPHRAPPLQPTP